MAKRKTPAKNTTRYYSPKWSELGVAAQYMHVFEIARGKNNQESMINARKQIAKCGIHISLDPQVVLAGHDLVTATVPELIEELSKRSLGLAVVSLQNGFDEIYHTKLKGNYHLLCGLMDRMGEEMNVIARQRRRNQEWNGN